MRETKKEPSKETDQWEINFDDVKSNKVKLHEPLFCRAEEVVSDPVAKEFVNMSMARVHTNGDGRCGVHALAGRAEFQGDKLGWQLQLKGPSKFIRTALRGTYEEVKERLPTLGQNLLHQLTEGF